MSTTSGDDGRSAPAPEDGAGAGEAAAPEGATGSREAAAPEDGAGAGEAAAPEDGAGAGEASADQDEAASARDGRTARALVFVRERFDGACLAFPVAAPDAASFGRDEDVLVEQQLFLREHAARAQPEAISRLSFPQGTELLSVDVAVPRDDLPRKLRREVPVSFPCVVVPAGERAAPTAQVTAPARGEHDAWVLVPSLGHAFHVEAGEPIEPAIRHEVRRLLASQDLSTWEHLGLLPGSAHRLEVLHAPLPEPEREQHGQRGVSIAERARRKTAVDALVSVATPLHVAAQRSPLAAPPLACRDAELARLAALLDGEERLGVLLVGPEHAGKTALMQAYVARQTRLVYATSGAQLIAGMSGLGQWQERIHGVMEAAAALDAVLYFENLDDLLAERVDGGHVDLAGAMRPYLDEGRVRVVCELRDDRLDALEGRHWAFFAGLSRIRVDPLSAADTRKALAERAAHDARVEPHRPTVAGDALTALIDLAERYLPYSAFPGKAVRLYEDLRTVHERERTAQGEPVTLGRSDLHELFSMRTGMPAFLLRDDLPLRVDRVARDLGASVVGQERAVRALAETIAVVKAGLSPPDKPLAAFLFVGPTGIGKTELARALAGLLFGSPDRLSRFDMSEFASEGAADRLIRGTDGAGGLLTQRVREQPFCVLLLDEIEKAHRAVFDLLLQVLGEGRLSDARGRTAYFHNAIVIMTSNLGAAERRAQAGFSGAPGASSPEERAALDEAHYQRVVAGAFRQEFVNRIDRVVPFRSLTRDELAEVARLTTQRLSQRRGLSEAGVALEVSPRALARLAADGHAPAYGARALRRHIEEHLAAPLARLLAGLGGDARELTVWVTEAGEPEAPAADGAVIGRAETAALRLEARRRRAARAAQQAFGVEQVGELRREVDLWMGLGPIEQLREQIDFLLTQLSLATGPSRDRRKELDTAALQAEHHRLSELWGRLARAQEEMHSVEELALMALLEGEEVRELAGEARAAREGFRKVLPRALVATESRRDAITLILEELDEGAFERWLAPMLKELPRRGWSATLHIDGDRAGHGDAAWPASRRWGPPRAPGDVLEALARPKRGFRSVLLRCTGAYAGAFLSLERGLHQLVVSKREAGAARDASNDGRLHVFVHFVAHAADIAEDQWEHRSLAPPPAGSAAARRRGATAREHDEVEGAVLIAGRRARIAMDPGWYWERLDEVALSHLLLFEDEGSGLDRSAYFSAGEDGERPD
ncbi:AAA family ATPase [Sorangium sp. So ce291]|uniref:AAA family ATPase n=1 Tax=Sorangium sp. So ce291 TaxID=3133294 RepID=UPI003F5F2477